ARPVVDDDQLERGEALVQHRADRLRQVAGAVVVGGDDRDERPPGAHDTACLGATSSSPSLRSQPSTSSWAQKPADQARCMIIAAGPDSRTAGSRLRAASTRPKLSDTRVQARAG